MFLLRRFPAAEARSRIVSLRKLYRKFLAENKRDARGMRLLQTWLSWTNERNSITQAISMSSVATLEEGTGFITE